MMHICAGGAMKQSIALAKACEKHSCPLENSSKTLKKLRLSDTVQAAEDLERQHGFIPNRILLDLLQRCTTNKDLEAGKCVHRLMVSNGLGSMSFYCDYLIRFYGFCENLGEANHVFYSVFEPTIYTWNAIISVHVKLGKCEGALRLYKKMQQEGTGPGRVTYLFLLKACGSMQALGHGQHIHNQIVEDGLHTDVIVGSTLVDMYCKCRNFEDARIVLHGLPHGNAVSWGAMIAGYVKSGEAFLALELFKVMQQQQGMKPDVHTFSCILKACSTAGAFQQGMVIHDMIIKGQLEADMVIGNTLVDMYAKCGGLEEAHKVFNTSLKWNVASWGALISGYVQHGEGLLALNLFCRVQQVQDVKPSKATFTCTLKACGMIKSIDQGMLIHAQIVLDELQFDVAVVNALIDMYVKCGKLNDAFSIFNLSPQKNVVSWGTIISGYVQQGNGTVALALFEEMQEQDIVPDEVLIICVVKACSIVCSTDLSQKMHDQIVRDCFDVSDNIQKSLVDMYINHALLVEAQKVFDSVSNKDVVLWSVMIHGYVQHGHSLSALTLFMKMQDVAKPDKFIFSCSLKACRNIGAIGHGRWIHNQVLTNGLENDVVVGGALVDMYTCCESLGEACAVFARLPNQNEVSWGAIIAGYAQSGNYMRIQEVLKSMQEQGLKPNDVIMTSVLAACSHAGLLKEGFCHFRFMQKLHGCVSSNTDYSCMVDLLGRAGCFNQASDLMETMPMCPDGFSWAALLTGIRTYSNSECVRECFDEFIEMNPREASGYIMMSSVVALNPSSNDVDNVERFKGLQKISAGYE